MVGITMESARTIRHVTAIFVVSLITCVEQGAGTPPGMYPCSSRGRVDEDNNHGRLLVTLDGSPTSYRPGSMYHVTVTSDTSFNILVVSGMITSSADVTMKCFPIYTHVSPDVTNRISFYWIAPLTGSGCVSLKVRASMRGRLVLNDIIGYQLCEEGHKLDLGYPQTSGILFKDNFDSGNFLERWSSESNGVVLDSMCKVMHGKAAVFCNMTSASRHLNSKAMDLRNATSLQFVLGVGSCSSNQARVKVSYRDVSSPDQWALLKSVRAPRDGHSSHVIVSGIPDAARREEVELRFSEDPLEGAMFGGCWGLDNILVISEAELPESMENDFDPIRIDDWLFHPGGSVDDVCSSTGNSMVMQNHGGPTYVTTRDVDLSEGVSKSRLVTRLSTTGHLGTALCELCALFRGGAIERGACGHGSAQDVHVFYHHGPRMLCTTTEDDLSDVAAASFTFSIGSGNCSRSRSHIGDVQVYGVINGTKRVIHTYHYDEYKRPTKVVVPLPGWAQSRDTILCLRQKSQHEKANTWALNSFRLIQQIDDFHHFVQFSVNLNCKDEPRQTKVKFQYSTDRGRSWRLVHKQCLPETCPGKTWDSSSVFDAAHIRSGWHRFTLPLPVSVLTEATRFRWIEAAPNATSQWAIDNVYIGSDGECPNMCSGRGSCASGGCRCDKGYFGSSCDVTNSTIPTFLSGGFNVESIDSSLFEEVSGGNVGFDCGILGSGKSLVFNQAEKRFIITKPLNATKLRYVQFTLLMGRTSGVGSCRPPDLPGEGVVVQYSINGGVSWKLLHSIPHNQHHIPEVTCLNLPQDAIASQLQIKWSQSTNHNKANRAVWAIDDVLVTSSLFKTAYSPYSVSFHLGDIMPYCNRTDVLAFTSHGPPHDHQVRYAETQSFQVTQGYVLQADLVIGCQRLLVNAEEMELNTTLELQYSTNHGRSWKLVNEVCHPGSKFSRPLYHAASTFHAGEYQTWTRVLVPLPEHTWSDGTRFRIAQYSFDERVDTWGLDDVYMGPGCPHHCRGHGLCRNGLCRCDIGFHGDECMPDHSLPEEISVTFDDVDAMMMSGWQIVGGHVTTNDKAEGCSPMTSSNYLHFNYKGVRKLETGDMSTTRGGQIQFYLQVGGGHCEGPRTRSNGILLQYSTDGGITWFPIEEFYHLDYAQPSYVHLDMPYEAKQPHIRFRWWQPTNRGENLDRWSIDDVIIGERNRPKVFVRDVIQPRAARLETKQQDGSTDAKNFSFLVLSNSGNPESFCSQRSESFVFNKLKGDRFAMTDDMNLNEGDTLQFQINVGCSSEFTFDSPVLLQFSHNSGYDWDYLRHDCYPRGRYFTDDDTSTRTSEDVTSHLCTGTARELSEATRYHHGDYDVWTPVVVVISAEVAARPVRFRWYQHVPLDGSVELVAEWAISDVYIGSSCPNYCSGHGLCYANNEGPRCACNHGYYEDVSGSCSSLVAHPSGVDGIVPWWGHLRGGAVGKGCGGSRRLSTLHFNQTGTREVRTNNLDTSRIRLIHFYVEIGGELCAAGRGQDENVILQYSLDNGIHWNLVKELDFETYASLQRHPELIDIPYKAKSPSTIFRWWQPLVGENERAPWTLYDVIIGRSDLLDNGLYDNFSLDAAHSRDKWYRINGGHVINHVGCQVLNTSSSRQPSLVFDAEQTETFAETWDLFILSGSFVQFDLVIGCIDDVTQNDVIDLEYSSDHGRNWRLVVQQCLPGSDIGCEHGFGSRYHQILNKGWTRHTVPIPNVIKNTRVRFRWMQYSHTSSHWAIDNIYIGNQCEWMCGGFGRCEPHGSAFKCRCDDNYQTPPNCQSSVVLTSSMKDDFNRPWSPHGRFGLVVGRDAAPQDFTSVDVIVEGESIRFSQSGVRMLQTVPFNSSDVRYVQFYDTFGEDDLEIKKVSHVVVQSSVNNGITWKTLIVLNSHRSDSRRFTNIKLPRSEQQQATMIRWWMANLAPARNEAVWAMDNLVIGGRASACEPHIIADNFSSLREDNWLFHSGGNVGMFCDDEDHQLEEEDTIVARSLVEASPGGAPESQDTVMVFSGGVGERTLMSRDMCVTGENYVIEFKIAIGCGVTNASARQWVKLEFSVDDGVTWNYVVPRCHGRDALGCSDERHPASIYYSGSWRGWRRVSVPLKPNIGDASSVRFRWRQGTYPFYSHDATVWAIDDVYIGPRCEQMCNGHGHCDAEEQVCICDNGYEGATCCDVIEGTNPSFFMEAFDEESSSANWIQKAGGAVTSSKCDMSTMFLRHRYEMTRPGARILMTRDINTRQSTFIQFLFKFTDHWLQDQDFGDMDPVHFQYSTDGGLSWVVIESFVPAPVNQMWHVAISTPEGANSNSTRFRWWEPSSFGFFTLEWSLDHVIIGGNVDEISDDFSKLHHHNWLELASVNHVKAGDAACCARGEECDYLHIGSSELSLRDCGRRWAATTGVNIEPGSFVHFHLTADCGQLNFQCHELSLEFSTDLGHSWALVQPRCFPTNPQCNAAAAGSVFSSDQFVTGQKVTIALPEPTWSSATRFRWRMPDDVDNMTWSLDDVYIGNGCHHACGGRGKCRRGVCECDDGWGDTWCHRALYTLPNELKDVFERHNGNSYAALVGGQVDGTCGAMGLNNALHFNKACSRTLVTQPMNTSEGDFVQFYFRFGCDGFQPINADQSVMLDYTRNGGVTWKKLMELRYDDYNDTRFVNILLPSLGRAVGVQFRWWQPSHDGAGRGDWAIDNLFIGGRRPGKYLSDSFALDPEADVTSSPLYLDRADVDMWLFYDNSRHASFCGSDDVIKAGVQPEMMASIQTKDFVASRGDIIQYTIVVSCQDVQQRHQPVHLQYSTDFGDSWQYVTSQCTPSDPHCSGKELTQATAHFISGDWRRRTLWIPDKLLGRPVRFRFHQYRSDVMWALDHIYIGSACPGACSGHGACLVRGGTARCSCDEGFGGGNCHLLEKRKTYLKDTFNNNVTMTQWRLLEGDQRNNDCGQLIDGLSLKFDDVGPRQAESIDLDLRDARFVQYFAVIGSQHTPVTCYLAQSRFHGIILQYSSDGGITWWFLRELMPSSYQTSTHDYISLPLEARTNSTRLRWWQPFPVDHSSGLVTMGTDRAGWALDDVYIGGHDVNSISLDDDMERTQLPRHNIGQLADENFDFHPNGVIDLDLCGSDPGSRLVMWPGGDEISVEQSLTTRQLLVSFGYMIQFKIRVGCSGAIDPCSRDFAVRLEYREEPLGVWQLVLEECFPGSTLSLTCAPFVHHSPSIYTVDRSWLRVTIPLDVIESETTQFRWYQQGGSPEQYSWALDDVYIGEACPGYCGGHGRCVEGPMCRCDPGYGGPDCSDPVAPFLIHDFKDDFELSSSTEGALATLSLWHVIDGGEVGFGGCGALRPYGFGRTVYFNGCKQRILQTVEMDVTMASFIQYVIQIGMSPSRGSCHASVNSSRAASVLFEYTTNNGVTWHLLKEHRIDRFTIPKRIAVQLPTKAKTDHTSMRWWQPRHNGAGADQWAMDNVEVIMSRANRHMQHLNGSRSPPSK